MEGPLCFYRPAGEGGSLCDQIVYRESDHLVPFLGLSVLLEFPAFSTL